MTREKIVNRDSLRELTVFALLLAIGVLGRWYELAWNFTPLAAVTAGPGVTNAVTALAQDVHDLEGLRTVGDLMAQRRADSPGGGTA